jgi:hypothetical protein
MPSFRRRKSPAAGRAFFCLLLLTLQATLFNASAVSQSAYAADISSIDVQPDSLPLSPTNVSPAPILLAASDLSAGASADIRGADFASQYTAISKRILLAGVKLERFSLNYRLETSKRPPLRQVRYVLAQEAGAAGGLAFEITGIKQFGIGRKHPLKLSTKDLKAALLTTGITSTVASASSGFELASNVLAGARRRHNGYDSASATKNVAAQLAEIDRLMLERDALVASHRAEPAYDRAVAEGEVLKQMRAAFVNEYSHFNVDSRSFFAIQNTFFALNAAYNAVGATAAFVGNKALHNSSLNGVTNVLFTVSGAMAMVSPALCVINGRLMRWHAQNVLDRELGVQPTYNEEQFSAKRKLLEEILPGAQGSLMPSLPATQRLALYTESDKLFVKQLDNETRVIRRLQSIALQTNLFAPPIGGCLMTQGILGTVGYYHDRLRPRKQLNLSYAGSIVGCVGISAALVGNAGFLLSSMAYENKLRQNHQLPAQLIKTRLEHLDDLQKLLEAL